MDTTWWPTVVSVFLVGLVGYYMRSNRADIMERVRAMAGEVTEIENRVKEDENLYLTEEKHDLLCRNSQLELKAYISEVLKTMQAQADKRFDGLERLIKNGHKT